MSTNTKRALRYQTVCKICQRISYAPPLDIPIIGQGDAQIGEYIMGTLVGHLRSEHPDVWLQVEAKLQEIGAFLACGMFNLQDPAIVARLDLLRYALHTATRKNNISDDGILDRLNRIGLEENNVKAVAALITDMRDALTEQGQYAPQSAPPSNLITV